MLAKCPDSDLFHPFPSNPIDTLLCPEQLAIIAIGTDLPFQRWKHDTTFDDNHNGKSNPGTPDIGILSARFFLASVYKILGQSYQDP